VGCSTPYEIGLQLKGKQTMTKTEYQLETTYDVSCARLGPAFRFWMVKSSSTHTARFCVSIVHKNDYETVEGLQKSLDANRKLALEYIREYARGGTETQKMQKLIEEFAQTEEVLL